MSSSVSFFVASRSRSNMVQNSSWPVARVVARLQRGHGQAQQTGHSRCRRGAHLRNNCVGHTRAQSHIGIVRIGKKGFVQKYDKLQQRVRRSNFFLDGGGVDANHLAQGRAHLRHPIVYLTPFVIFPGAHFFCGQCLNMCGSTCCMQAQNLASTSHIRTQPCMTYSCLRWWGYSLGSASPPDLP